MITSLYIWAQLEHGTTIFPACIVNSCFAGLHFMLMCLGEHVQL